MYRGKCLFKCVFFVFFLFHSTWRFFYRDVSRGTSRPLTSAATPPARARTFPPYRVYVCPYYESHHGEGSRRCRRLLTRAVLAGVFALLYFFRSYLSVFHWQENPLGFYKNMTYAKSAHPALIGVDSKNCRRRGASRLRRFARPILDVLASWRRFSRGKSRKKQPHRRRPKSSSKKITYLSEKFPEIRQPFLGPVHVFYHGVGLVGWVCFQRCISLISLLVMYTFFTTGRRE